VLALAVVGLWIVRRVGHRDHPVRIERTAPAVDALAPGDMRIYSRDSALDVVLVGDRILAGLSPQTIAKVRAKIDASKAGDSSGIGGMIASTVKSAVSQNIGVHVEHRLADLRDVVYRDGHLYIVFTDGTETEMLGNAKISSDGDTHQGVLVNEADAQRFIAAVHARKAELRLP
jgi:hypothetical protein